MQHCDDNLGDPGCVAMAKTGKLIRMEEVLGLFGFRLRMAALWAFILAGGILSFGLTGCGKKPVPAVKVAPAEKIELEDSAAAATVFSSFGADGSYETRVGGAMVDASAEFRRHPERFRPDMRDNVNIEHGYRGQAEWFVPDTAGELRQIQIAIARGGKGSGLANIFLAEDKGGIPGAKIECFSNVICSATSVQPLKPVTLASITRPAILSGKKYWLCAEPSDEKADNTWFCNNRHLNRGFAYERSPWDWSFVEGGPDNGAFSVTLTAKK